MTSVESIRHAFLDWPLPIAFAHRGGALEEDENTMAAFANAIGMGYRYLETDVQASRDGVAVVFHYDRLSDFTDGTGKVGDHSWAELSRMRTPGGHGLPRLEEVLDAWPEVRVNIEPKTDAAVEPIAEVIRRCDALERVCVGSFDVRRTLKLCRKLGEGLCWSPSYGGVAQLWFGAWGVPTGRPKFPVVQIPPSHYGLPIVTRRVVDAAHSQGVQVHVWTINEEAEMERLLDIGVDALMTDRPSLLKRVLVRRGQWTGA
jgi:glycerophosphoryl diester phosphodiesterase